MLGGIVIGMVVPLFQIIIAKNTLMVFDQCKIHTLITSIVGDGYEHFFLEVDVCFEGLFSLKKNLDFIGDKLSFEGRFDLRDENF